jgi:hypothetical protein
MGLYTSVAAVQAEFKDITFSASTKVTTDDVTEFILQEEYALEGEVAQVYEIPVTGTRALAIMKLMATLLVKARILDILPVKTGNETTEQGGPGDKLRERVNAMLEKIKKKELILTDGTLEESSGGIRSYTSDNVVARTFSRDDGADGTPSEW